jgi:hypothetical protein
MEINKKVFPVTEETAQGHRKKVLKVYFDLKNKPHRRQDPIFYWAEIQVWREYCLERVYSSFDQFCQLMSLLKKKKTT